MSVEHIGESFTTMCKEDGRYLFIVTWRRPVTMTDPCVSNLPSLYGEALANGPDGRYKIIYRPYSTNNLWSIKRLTGLCDAASDGTWLPVWKFGKLIGCAWNSKTWHIVWNLINSNLGVGRFSKGIETDVNDNVPAFFKLNYKQDENYFKLNTNYTQVTL